MKDLTMNFIFISKEDEYFIGETKLVSDCTDWTPTTIIDDGWGLFEGKTMVSYKGYKGDLPRDDGDTASFSEFDIYYNNILINNKTYSEILSLIRDNKIENIITF